MVDASTIDNGLLISLIEKYTVLWDKNMEFYKNRMATDAAWKQVLKSLNPEYMSWNNETRKEYVKLIKQRWTHIRDNYFRSYRKQTQKNPNARPTKPYLYSKKCAFLQKILPINEQVNTEVNGKTEQQENDSASIYISDNSFDTNDMGMNSSLDNMPMNSSVDNMPGLEGASTHNDDANDPFSTREPSETNRHLLFFKGVLPSLDDFDDNETIDFQMGVLKLVKKIKGSRRGKKFSSFNIKFEDDSDSPGYASNQ